MAAISPAELNGTIPPELANLTRLAELDLSTNRLTGGLPRELCGDTSRVSNLRDLIVSNNELSGPLELPDCENLISLDAQVRVAGCG